MIFHSYVELPEGNYSDIYIYICMYIYIYICIYIVIVIDIHLLNVDSMIRVHINHQSTSAALGKKSARDRFPQRVGVAMAIDAWAYGVLAAFIFMVVCPLAPRMARVGWCQIWKHIKGSDMENGNIMSCIDYMYTVYTYIYIDICNYISSYNDNEMMNFSDYV